MSQRISLLSGNNINTDNDLSAHIDSIATPWVINWLEVSDTQITRGRAFVEVTRTVTSPDETFYVLYELDETLGISPSASQYVYIKVDENAINNGSNNTEDGIGIGEIEVSDVTPTENYLLLAETDSTGAIDTTNRETGKIKPEKIWDGWANKLYYTDNNWNIQELSFGSPSQTLVSTWATSAPEWSSPSVDINWLTEETTPAKTDEALIYDWTWNKKTTLSNLTKGLDEADENTKGTVERATDAEVEAWTDTTRYVTPKQAKDNYDVTIFGSSSEIIAEIWNSTTTTSTDYVKKWEFEIEKDWEYYISARCQWTVTWPTYTVYIAIYKNWDLVIENSDTGGSPAPSATTSTTLSLVAWDLIQWYIKVSSERVRLDYLSMWAVTFPTKYIPSWTLL